MCWCKEAFLPGAFIIFFSLITSIKCDSFSYASEGGSVKLQFPYPRSSTKVTLQYANRRPFYSSTNLDFLELNPDQSERFTVDHTTEGDHRFLQLSIDRVKRLDGGTYILLTHNGDYITRIGLHVDFLPGVAHCSFGGSHDYTGDWEKLHCEATRGSMLGQIQCYQRGERMPHLDAPSENDKTLKQTILVRRNHHHVHCCSSQLIEPKENCDCNDIVWAPLSKGEAHNPEDPCPTTKQVLTAPLTTSFHYDHSSSTVRAIIPTKGENKDNIYPINKFPIVLNTVTFVMLMIFFIIQIILLSRSKFMSRISNAKKNVADSESVAYI